MVKYKVNLKFKDTEKSLNEIITQVLKIELEKKINMTFNIFKKDLPCDHAHYFLNRRSNN